MDSPHKGRVTGRKRLEDEGTEQSKEKKQSTSTPSQDECFDEKGDNILNKYINTKEQEIGEGGASPSQILTQAQTPTESQTPTQTQSLAQNLYQAPTHDEKQPQTQSLLEEQSLEEKTSHDKRQEDGSIVIGEYNKNFTMDDLVDSEDCEVDTILNEE